MTDQVNYGLDPLQNINELQLMSSRKIEAIFKTCTNPNSLWESIKSELLALKASMADKKTNRIMDILNNQREQRWLRELEILVNACFQNQALLPEIEKIRDLGVSEVSRLALSHSH